MGANKTRHFGNHTLSPTIGHVCNITRQKARPGNQIEVRGKGVEPLTQAMMSGFMEHRPQRRTDDSSDWTTWQ